MGIHEGGATHILVLYVAEGSEREQCQLLGSCSTFKRLVVSATTTTPTDFYRISETLSYSCWKPGLHSLSQSPVVPPGFSTGKCGTVWAISCCSISLAHLVCQRPPCLNSSSCSLPISAPPTSLEEGFFFNSLVVRFPLSSIFWQFWLFLFLNWLYPSFGCAGK